MNEAWKYTDKNLFELDKIEKGKQKIEFSSQEHILSSENLKVKTMSLLKKEDEFIKQHAENISNEIHIYIPKNKEVVLTSKIISQAGETFNHIVIVIEENAFLTYVEEHTSEDKAYRNDAVEIYLKQNAKLNFYSFQNWEHEVVSINNIASTLGKDARLNYVFGQFGGKVSRLKIDTIFNGRGSESKIYGVFFGNKNQHFDITTNSNHLVENTQSDVLVNGVLDGKSTSVYRGKIKISEQAQKTDSYLSNHNLVLNEGAVAYSIPSLEIDANDVSASHGSTTGKPNEEELFYLRTRGLGKEEAERLIIQGFFSKITDKISIERLKERFNQAVKTKIR